MNSNYSRLAVPVAFLLVIALILSQFLIFVVDQREYAVVLQFGNPVRAVTKPGIHMKIPFVETVRILPSTLQFWGDDSSDKLPDLPTKDDKKIELVPWAVWKINDPIAFVTRLRTMENAEQRVAQFTRGAMRDVITQFELADLVRSTNREMKTAQLDIASHDTAVPKEVLPEGLEMAVESKKTSTHVIGRQAILKEINEEARGRMTASTDVDEALQARGIELIDVGISHIDFVDSVRMKTFERWKAERDAISTRNITEGERLKQEILNSTNSEVERIHGEGQRTASETRGHADAQVIKRYADGIAATGEFYTFVRTLEAYEKALSNQTQLILTTDNDFLKQLKHLGVSDSAATILPTVPPTVTSPGTPPAETTPAAAPEAAPAAETTPEVTTPAETTPPAASPEGQP